MAQKRTSQGKLTKEANPKPAQAGVTSYAAKRKSLLACWWTVWAIGVPLHIRSEELRSRMACVLWLAAVQQALVQKRISKAWQTGICSD